MKTLLIITALMAIITPACQKKRIIDRPKIVSEKDKGIRMSEDETLAEAAIDKRDHPMNVMEKEPANGNYKEPDVILTNSYKNRQYQKEKVLQNVKGHIGSLKKRGEDHKTGYEEASRKPSGQKRSADELYSLAIAAIKAGDRKAAKEFYLSSCQAGSALACHRFGWQLSKEGSHDNARNFYKLACDRGINKSCNNLGWAEERDGERNKAKKFYDIACQRNHVSACNNSKRIRMLNPVSHH